MSGCNLSTILHTDAYAGVGGSYTYDDALCARIPNSIVVNGEKIVIRITHKRGDTFVMSAAAKNADGTGVDLTGYTIESHIRSKGGVLIAQPAVTITNAQAGEYDLTVADTTAWPITALFMDVQYTAPSSGVESSETLMIIVEEDITV